MLIVYFSSTPFIACSLAHVMLKFLFLMPIYSLLYILCLSSCALELLGSFQCVSDIRLNHLMVEKLQKVDVRQV